MKRIGIGIMVAVLAFFLGIAISKIWSISRHEAAQRSVVLTSSRDEEWHRLYEAAGLTGDQVIIKEVNDRLLCANSAGVQDAWLVELETTRVCKKSDGSIHEPFASDTSEYGPFFKHITASHSSWALQNLDFIRGIITAGRAKEYVSRQRGRGDGVRR
jgi:hypothetical protein